MTPTPHTHKVKFKGESVQKIEWKQTDGRTGATDCFTFPANAVGNNTIHYDFILCI